MLLNAREIHVMVDEGEKPVPPIILVAMEDVTEMMVVAEMLAGHAKHLGAKLTARTLKLEGQIKNLEKEIRALQKPLKK